MLFENTKKCFSVTKSYEQTAFGKYSKRSHLPSQHLAAADGWNRSGAGRGCFCPTAPCPLWPFSPSKEGAKSKADFIHCVYSAVLLGHRRGRGFCSLARGCQGRWFLSRWHPLMEENTGRILLLRHKIRGVFLKRSSVSFQAAARLLLVCPLKCHCLNLSHLPGCAGLCFGREKDA